MEKFKVINFGKRFKTTILTIALAREVKMLLLSPPENSISFFNRKSDREKMHQSK
jgi:hypothetical protein